MNQNKKRIFSGIQPSGMLHLGNYVGAILQWLEVQHQYQSFFCVVDWHTLTIPQALTAKQRVANCHQTIALYLACGIDPKACTLFIQSHVKEHTELAWILNCVTPVGWLERMTQYKSKSQTQKSVGAGLMNYPVLMAADILLYQTDIVPVGDDQKQHVEISCDIAERFNHMFGPTFKVPKVEIRESGARIMGLDDPTQKMSKSIGELKAGHLVGLLDSEKQLKKTIMSAVTDSSQETRFDHAGAGVLNLLAIYQTLSKQSKTQIEERFAGQGYGFLKKSVIEIVLETLTPIQQRYNDLIKNWDYLNQIIQTGSETARACACLTMTKVNQTLGLGSQHI